MCMATCLPLCCTSTGLAQVRPWLVTSALPCPTTVHCPSAGSAFKAVPCACRPATPRAHRALQLADLFVPVPVLTCLCAWCSGCVTALDREGVQEGARRAARYAAIAARLVSCLAGGL